MRTPQRGDIYRVRRDIAGKRRPVIIVSRTELNKGATVLAIPLTTAQFEKRMTQRSFVVFETGEGGLPEQSLAKCSDITTLRIADLDLANGYVGSLNENKMQRLFSPLNWSMGFIDT